MQAEDVNPPVLSEVVVEGKRAGGVPSLDYAELRFYKKTRWGDF